MGKVTDATKKASRGEAWVLAGFILLACSLLVAGFLGYLLIGTSAAEGRQQEHLLRDLGPVLPHDLITTSGNHPAPQTARQPLGTALGILEVPRLHLKAAFLEGAYENQLEVGPGHMEATPLPGQAGDAVVAGHRTTWGKPFADLDQLRIGDRAIATTPQGRFVFAVTSTSIVLPSDLGGIIATTGPSLTLLTCTPRYSASHRLLVHFDEVERSAPLSTQGTSLPIRVTGKHGAGWRTLLLGSIVALLIGVIIWQRHRTLLVATLSLVMLPSCYFFYAGLAALLPSGL